MNLSFTSRSVLAAALAVVMATALPACATNQNKTGAERTGEVIGNAAEKTGDVVSDSWITTKVKSMLVADELVKAREINVTTDNGVVTLAGLLNSSAERSRAVKIASETKGVKRVNTTALKVQ